MKYPVYNQKGKEAGETELPEDIFNVKVNADLVHQVTVSQMSNRRTATAHTKDRGEVRGGGKKPWRQKGLGRARHGSIRSPIWVGGGVTFGPTNERNFKKNIPVKMRRQALFMVLSAKAKEKFLVLLDELKIDEPKTKLVAEILKALPSAEGTAVLAIPNMDKKVIQAARNIKGLNTIQAKDLNCLELLSFKYLVMPKASIEVIKNTFSANKQ
jgi:large subunit ribosomal protein L4